MSRFIESIRVENGTPLRLELHEQRVVSTYQSFFHCLPSWKLRDVVEQQRIPAEGVLKCRVTYGRDPESIGFEPYTISTIRSLKVVDGGDMDYKHKYADRQQLNMLFDQRNGRDDILILVNGLVTDTSFGNIAVMTESGQWHTPATYLLDGIMRRHLIETGRIFERHIDIRILRRYKRFRVINALRGWDTSEGEVLDID
jgi:4-amino-4-deoxychorismate lyase